MDTLVSPVRTATGWTPLRMAVMAALVLLAVWLGWKAWAVNITLSCWKEEWPHLPACEAINGRTPQEKAARLERRLADNPGESWALVALTVYAHQPGVAPHLDPLALLERARRAAPQNGDVLRLQVHHAMNDKRWTEALDPLIRLSRFHHDAQATRTLTEMVNHAQVDADLGNALVAAARADTGWLDRVLLTLPQARVPTVIAMPLIQELVDRKSLTPRLGIALIGQLKAEGQWLEAHALWMHLWDRPLPLLFNGDFETAFVQGGFDWEVPGSNDHRAGAVVSQVGRKERGQVMQVEFKGRQMGVPVVRQYLMLPPGRYRFGGDYLATGLRSEQGLAWVFACAGARDELARVPAMASSGRDWRHMELVVDVPPACGLGVMLSLQPHADFESRTGMRGEILFDRFQLSMQAVPP